MNAVTLRGLRARQRRQHRQPGHHQARARRRVHGAAGSTLPDTTNNFGGSSAEFGALYPQTYWVFGGHGATHTVINDYNSRAFANPC